MFMSNNLPIKMVMSNNLQPMKKMLICKTTMIRQEKKVLATQGSLWLWKIVCEKSRIVGRTSYRLM